MDSRSNLWVGGDNNRSLDSHGKQHTVGFTPFAPRTVTAPSAPPKLSVQRYGSTDKLSWPGVRENSTRYQVLRDDRPIATVRGTSYSVDYHDGVHYYVRAVDTTDNYSASTKAVQAV